MGKSGVLRHIGEYQKEGRELNLHLSVGWFREAEQGLKENEQHKKKEDYER